MNLRYILLIAVSIFIWNSADAFAGNLDIPYNFSSSGTPAMASDVYANFKAVESAIDDNDRRIERLETDIVNIKSRVSSFQTMGDTDQETTRKLQQAVDSLQKTVKNQQATITLLESKIDSFQDKDKAQQEKIADFMKRLEALEKRKETGSHLNSE